MKCDYCGANAPKPFHAITLYDDTPGTICDTCHRNDVQALELEIDANRGEMRHISQLEPGGEGAVEKLLAREKELFRRMDALNNIVR